MYKCKKCGNVINEEKETVPQCCGEDMEKVDKAA
jgi:RNA polymerase subunit RPABC4/transcription elongation factor Spt4